MGETICQLCGDVGAQNALVFCVKCLDFAIHRYCLHVIPETLDEFVRWFCVDCEEKYGKSYTDEESLLVPLKKLGLKASEKFPSLRSKPPKPMKTKHNKSTNGSSQHKLIKSVTKEKEKKEISGMVKEIAEKRHQRTQKIQNEVANSDKLVHDSPTKAKKSEKSILCVSPIDVVTDLEETKGQYSPCVADNENVIYEGEKLCIADADAAKISLESEMVPVDSSILQDGEHIPVQPVIDQIWRGSFDIETDGRGLYDGLAAHLSNKACPKVWEEANLLSESICMELVSKKSVWPKRFQKSKPSDEHIALYFFPLNNKSCIKVYDKLVSEMLSHELALRAVVKNAQLLVFTSSELPYTYWTFEGKFYLWGVFVAKQAVLSDSSPKSQPMIPNGEENMALDSLSPISTLNNISSAGLRWTLPEAGELKLDVYASFNRDTREGAIGVFIRDSEGKWVRGVYMYLGLFNPETAEICAIFRGLALAWKLGNIHKVTIESNSVKAIEAVSSASSDHPCYCDIEVIRRRLMDSKWSCWIKLINREANTCANRLAQEAFSSSSRMKELPNPPKFMLDFLASDLEMGIDGNYDV